MVNYLFVSIRSSLQTQSRYFLVFFVLIDLVATSSAKQVTTFQDIVILILKYKHALRVASLLAYIAGCHSLVNMLIQTPLRPL